MVQLLLFVVLVCTGIREERPSRDILKEYFAVGTEESRHWHGLSLAQAVQKGLDLSARHPQKAPFMWLTAYNSGAARVALAALSLLGISEEDLDAGFPSDPDASPDPKFAPVWSLNIYCGSSLCLFGFSLYCGSSVRCVCIVFSFLSLFHHRYRLNILARPGLLIRLTQNLDKSRGFVNGFPYGTSSARCFSLMPASRSFWKLGVLLCAWLVGLAGLLSMVAFEVRSFILASTLEVIDLY